MEQPSRYPNAWKPSQVLILTQDVSTKAYAPESFGAILNAAHILGYIIEESMPNKVVLKRPTDQTTLFLITCNILQPS